MNPEFEGEKTEEEMLEVIENPFDIHKERKNNFRKFLKNNKSPRQKRKK